MGADEVNRLLVNDCLSVLENHRTFWHDLAEWFRPDFYGGDYGTLAEGAAAVLEEQGPTTVIRNASYFGPIPAAGNRTISLLQDIMLEGKLREMQETVIRHSQAVVFNSRFTQNQYAAPVGIAQMLPPDGQPKLISTVIPLPVDFRTFEPGNAMGLQQSLSLPQGCILWVGASQGPAAEIKGWDVFLTIVRLNPDLPFVAVFKDAIPEQFPPNLRCFCQVSHEELAKIIGACSVGLCTSRMESQHLAGIEMGACGLPIVVPPVGTYWEREEMPGIIESDFNVPAYSAAVRKLREQQFDAEQIRTYWEREFHPEIVRLQWTALVNKVENGAA